MDQQDKSKEWQLLEKVAMSSVAEQKRARRWGIFFKLLGFGYLFFMLALFMPERDRLADAGSKGKHTALVKLQGMILHEEAASANAVVTGLRNAFEAKNSQAVLLAINSPGGSPVQAGYIYDEIRRLREKHPDKKLYAVISDLGASGAYYAAAAADEIYADRASLVGSIGVISASFGYTGAMEKLGIERRVITAGDNKAFLDPFQELREEDKQFWQQSLALIHGQFIERVRQGRGDRLLNDEEIFSGLIWSGEQALELGLVDGLGSAGYVAREVIGYEDIVDYSVKPNPLEALIRQFGMSAGRAMARFVMLQGQYPELQ